MVHETEGENAGAKTTIWTWRDIKGITRGGHINNSRTKIPQKTKATLRGDTGSLLKFVFLSSRSFLYFGFPCLDFTTPSDLPVAGPSTSKRYRAKWQDMPTVLLLFFAQQQQQPRKDKSLKVFHFGKREGDNNNNNKKKKGHHSSGVRAINFIIFPNRRKKRQGWSDMIVALKDLTRRSVFVSGSYFAC